eukprot:33494-Chlamydomonas_euryale.AAC.2
MRTPQPNRLGVARQHDRACHSHTVWNPFFIPSRAGTAAVPQGIVHAAPGTFHRALSIHAAARKRRRWGNWHLASSLAPSRHLLRFSRPRAIPE